MRERLLHIEKLEQAARRGAFVRLLIGSSLNLVVEEIIEVSCVQYPSACKQTLLEAGLEGPSAFRQQARVRHVVGQPGKSLIQSRLHEPRGIGETQARTGKNFSAT